MGLGIGSSLFEISSLSFGLNGLQKVGVLFDSLSSQAVNVDSCFLNGSDGEGFGCRLALRTIQMTFGMATNHMEVHEQKAELWRALF